MSFNIELSKEADRDLSQLIKADKKLLQRIVAKIETLSENPLQGKPLTGNHQGEYSFRVGTYRIIYEIDESLQTVFVLTDKHRKHVY